MGNRERSFVGQSPSFRALLERLALCRAADVPVLIQGESGTGKELIARALHEGGARAHGPFVAVNMAGLPDTMVESELFGHEAGAFTGATEARPGLVREAEGGTLFLDEMGEVSPQTQARLLRFLQNYTVRPLGGTKEIEVDVRVVAATNRDLTRLVREGRFREDLYFRLNVLSIEPPPLRERTGDVTLLARHFLGSHPISDAALGALEAHPWRGNVRELENVIRRAVLLSGGEVIEVTHLDLRGSERPAQTLEDHERDLIARTLLANGGNVSQTARQLGMNRGTLHRKIKEWNLTRAA